MRLPTTADTALLQDLFRDHGPDVLLRLVQAAMLHDMEEAHIEAMQDEETRIVYDFDAADLDPSDIAEWFDGLSDSVLDIHFGG